MTKSKAQEVKVFGRMFDKGYIYKGLKPVTWCPFCTTAVAEADIEYKDDPCMRSISMNGTLIAHAKRAVQQSHPQTLQQ